MTRYLFILLIISPACFAQSKYKLIASIDAQADFFTTDNQSNIYVVKGNELTKYNKTGKLLYKYSNKNLGNIDFIDASNMMRPLVYYKNFLQVVFLDNTLSMDSEPISLDKMGYQQAQLVCTSHNNNFWLFDQQNIQLVRISKTLETVIQTGNLSVLLNLSLQPNYLLEYDNRVYLNNPTSGVLIFDIYGTYYKTFPVKQLEHFQPIGDEIYYLTENKIASYNIKTTEIKQAELPTSDVKKIRVENGMLILQTSTKIELYRTE